VNGLPIAYMRVLEDLKRTVPRCPHCGCVDLQVDNGLVECDQCPWTGSDYEVRQSSVRPPQRQFGFRRRYL
jgi:hypothetical protein